MPPPPPLRVCPHIRPIRPRKQQIGDLLWRPHPRTPNPTFAKPPRANASSTHAEPCLREIPAHLRRIGDIHNLRDLLWRLRDIHADNTASSASASSVGCRSASLVVVSLYGGQVVSWRNDHDEDLLFISSKVQV
uniref:Uncharacterized protein n=1 Tax=Zea mays TaxID=4577 RepID=A0A804QJC8_MAIZE